MFLRRSISILAITIIFHTSGCKEAGEISEAAKKAAASIQGAVDTLNKGVDTFEDLTKLLEDTKSKLDDGTYQAQVEKIITRTGQIVDLNLKTSVDFVRQRVSEDLTNIKRKILGQKPLERKPVLTIPDAFNIDFKNENLKSITIVGWNLDVAKNNNYKVVIKNSKTGDRDVSKLNVPYQGQYAVTVNLSGSGEKLINDDAQLSFEGYKESYAIAIVNSQKDPILPPTEKVVNVTAKLFVTDDDLDKHNWIRVTLKAENNVVFTLDGAEKTNPKKWPDQSGPYPFGGKLTSGILPGTPGTILIEKFADKDGDPRDGVSLEIKLSAKTNKENDKSYHTEDWKFHLQDQVTTKEFSFTW